MTLYEILGVPETASNSQIRDAYRNLAKQYHPDNFKGASNPFKEIQAAWEVLKDTQKKAAYDAKLRSSRYAPPPPPNQHHYNYQPPPPRPPVTQPIQTATSSKTSLGTIILAILITFGLLVTCGVVFNSSNTDNSTNTTTNSTNNSLSSFTSLPTPTPSLSKEEYIKNSVFISVSALTREPSKYNYANFNRPVSFKGKFERFFKDDKTGDVFGGAVVDANEKSILRDNTNEVFVDFSKKIDLSRIGENDIITFYGRCNGVADAVDALGNKVNSKFTNVQVEYVKDQTSGYSN